MKSILPKIKGFCKAYYYDGFMFICAGLVGLIGYNLGHINALEKQPVVLGKDAAILKALENSQITVDDAKTKVFTANSRIASSSFTPLPPRDPRVVVSKNSSSNKYHYGWCASGKRIKPENQIWFENEEAALKEGYTLAGNCPP